MNTQRMNITIPRELFARLSRINNKSAYIAEALREKLQAEENVRKKKMLATAYREAAREESKLIEDWDQIAGDAL